MHMFEEIQGHSIYAASAWSEPVIFDLGANRGEFSRQMSARHGGTYHLVEANPALAEALRIEGRFPVWHCALAAAEGRIRFNIAENDEGSSILPLPKESEYNCVFRESVEVQARTLESLLTEVRPARIDLVKMDIEGAEVPVLRSLSAATLRRIGQITVEFHSDPVFGFDLSREVEDVIRHMRRHGFVCMDFSGTTRRDVLFINVEALGISRRQRLRWGLREHTPTWLLDGWNRMPPGLKNGVRRLLPGMT